MAGHAISESIVATIDRPSVRRLLAILAFASVAAVLALFAFGALMLTTVVNALIPPLAVVGVAAIPAIAYRFIGWTPLHVVLIVPLIALVPIVGLLAFDVLWASVGFKRPDPEFGFLIAGVVVGCVAYSYLRWLGAPEPPHAWRWAAFAFFSSLVLSVVVRGRVPEFKLFATATCVFAATWIYLHWVAGPHIAHPFWWTLLLVVIAVIAFPLVGDAVKRHELNVGLLVAGFVVSAIAGLCLLGAPEPPGHHVRRLVGGVCLAGLAVPLLLLVVAKVAFPSPHEVHPTRLPVAESATVPQAAIDHRPVLLFDSGEKLRTPLNVDAMFATKAVELCPEDRGPLANCSQLESAADLRNGVGNLRFETKQIEGADIPTTIYVHAVPDASDSDLQDLDYWWYLPDNPVNTARGAMCGAGLVIPDITCFDHQSDWEGITLVVKRDSGDPVAVHYAAHNHVINVTWQKLQELAGKPPIASYPQHRLAAQHPLVFIARGSHAAYPVPCTADFCDSGTPWEDNQHDGAQEWLCEGASCVSALPTRAGGTQAASWSAFDGLWGTALCVGKVYCASSQAPNSPGKQPRYKRPSCYGYEVVANPRIPSAVKTRPPGCR